MKYLLIIIFLAVLSGCVPKQPVVDYDSLDITDILNSIKTDHEEIQSLRGIARVKAKSNFDDVAINQITLLELPLKFRLEALAVFGQSIAVVTSDGEKVIFRTSGDEITFQDVKNFNLSYFYPGIPEELKTEQLIELLMGKVPFGLWEEEYEVVPDKAGGRIAVEYINSGGTQTVTFIDPLSGNIESAEIVLEGDSLLYINYTNYQKMDNLAFPKNIEFKYLAYELSVKYGELTVNDIIEDSLFFQ